MESADLLLICASAFVAVFLLLALLSLVMRLITAVFPQHEMVADAAYVAAITAAVASLYPGTRVTKVEERK
jgi:uncharacterized membrane protein YqjE